MTTSNFERRKASKDIFSTDKLQIGAILEMIHEGSIQLPDFQRSWTWDNDHIVDLIESVGECSPIGAIMTIETGGELNFSHLPIYSVDPVRVASVKPSSLVMDGQQRVTSLYQVLFSKKPVRIEKKGGAAEYRSYLFDMEKALDSSVDLKDALLSVVVDEFGKPVKKKEQDYSDLNLLASKMLFPLNYMFDASSYESIYQEYWYSREDLSIEEKRNAVGVIREFRDSIETAFTHSQIPVIILRKGISLEAVSKLYQKLNSRGVALDAFDLLIARYAAQNYNLRDSWNHIQEQLNESSNGLLDDLQANNFLMSVHILSHVMERKTPQTDRQAILKITLEQYKTHQEILVRGYKQAIRYLRHKKVEIKKDRPILSVIAALAIIFAIVKEADDHRTREKIDRWFWCIMFSNSYAGAHPAATATDLIQLIDWINNTTTSPPRTISNVVLLDTNLMRKHKSKGNVAAKAINISLMDEVRDFTTGHFVDDYNKFDGKYDMHHIFPKSWCKANSIPEEMYDSIVNLTPMSEDTNRQKLGGLAPSAYIEKIQQKFSISDTMMSDIITSHGINPEHLLNDDFESFFAEREQHLLSLIERRIGTRVARSKDMKAENPESGVYENATRWILNSRGVVIEAIAGPNNSLIILPGSTMSSNTNASLRVGYLNARNLLIKERKVEHNSDGTYRVLEPLTMESPSWAGSVLTGRMTNAEDWKVISPEQDEDDSDGIDSDQDTPQQLSLV